MSDTQTNSLALRRVFSDEDWVVLSEIPAFTQLTQNLASLDDMSNALKKGLELLENQKLGRRTFLIGNLEERFRHPQ